MLLMSKPPTQGVLLLKDSLIARRSISKWGSRSKAFLFATPAYVEEFPPLLSLAFPMGCFPQ